MPPYPGQADGVAHQVGERLRQGVGVHVDLARPCRIECRGVNLDADVLGCGIGANSARCALQKVADGYINALERHTPGLDLHCSVFAEGPQGISPRPDQDQSSRIHRQAPHHVPGLRAYVS